MIHDQIRHLAIDVSSVSTHPRNARRGDVDRIARSLELHGQYRPIVVNERTHEVLAGNHTLMAARKLGWLEVAATFVDVDDETALRILAADNRLSDLAGYDDTALMDLLSALNDTAGGLDGVGYEYADIEKLLAKLDGTPTPADISGFADRYEVVVECQTEDEQAALLLRLSAEGLKVRAIVV